MIIINKNNNNKDNKNNKNFNHDNISNKTIINDNNNYKTTHNNKTPHIAVYIGHFLSMYLLVCLHLLTNSRLLFNRFLQSLIKIKSFSVRQRLHSFIPLL